MKADGTSHAALKRMYGEKSKAEKVARPMFKVAVGGRHEQCRGAWRSHLPVFASDKRGGFGGQEPVAPET